MVKNIALSDETTYIPYLSPTESGSVHDMVIAKENPLNLPKGCTLKQDLGFQGHSLTDVIVEIPFKKPKNGELTFSQRIYNKLLNSTRVVVEHAFSGVKRLRILRDTIRIHSTQTRDLVMCVGVGLHNLRVTLTACAQV